jgi:hypothetical protein
MVKNDSSAEILNEGRPMGVAVGRNLFAPRFGDGYRRCGLDFARS